MYRCSEKTVLYQSISHPQAVLSHLSEQRSQGLFCDVIIVVEDVKFRAHRNILAATSGYFRNAFKTPEVYTSSQVLELTDLKSEVFASILNFIYNARVESSSTEDSRSLVAAGKRLGIPFLEKLLDSERSNSQSKLADTCTLKKETLKPEELDCSKGPRITNAFSITEVEAVNNPFSTLDHSNKVIEGLEEGPPPSSSQDTSISPIESEPANALTEHSYQCTETFSDSTLLTIHMQIHKRFVSHLFCKYCRKKFMHLKRLRNHEQVCAKSLKDCLRVPVSNGASNANTTQHSLRPQDLHIPLNLEPTLTSPLEILKRHENVHSWHRAYPCHYCNKVFKNTGSSLITHGSNRDSSTEKNTENSTDILPFLNIPSVCSFEGLSKLSELSAAAQTIEDMANQLLQARP
uniref:Zinc finger and BTB domain containing 38 n=1 Tax=Cyprinus carpio TaxID=7962 RepID=A0A8C2BVV7_CYPCA